MLNGDTIFDINLNNIIKVKLEKHSMFLALTNSKKKKYGKLHNLNLNGKLVIFDQKFKYKNAGVYLLQKSILKNLSSNTFCSLEDIVEKKIKMKKVIGKYYNSYFIDIGTPKDLKMSEKHFQRYFKNYTIFFVIYHFIKLPF